MTQDTAYKLAKLIVIGMFVLLFVLGYTMWSGYEGRKALVDSQRAGCERSKLDRSANASGWRNAEDARRAAGEIEVADEYARIASELEQRSKTVCSQAFPKASFIP